MTDLKQPFSRRRLLAGAGVGTAAVWAAPAITTLGRAGAASANGSCVTVYETLLGELKNQPVTYLAGMSVAFSNGSNLFFTSGSANLTGPNTMFTSPNYPSVAAIDLNGEGQGGGTTVLQTDSISPGTYTVELSIGGTFPAPNGDNNNEISVNFGGVIFNTPLGPGVAINTFSSSVTILASTALTITHIDADPTDNIGMFLGGVRICKTG